MGNSTPRARRAAGKAVSFAGGTPQRACTPSFLELTPDEEQALIERILDIDQRGHVLQLFDVEYMADYLLLVRNIEKTGTANQAGQVSRDWAREFVGRTPALKICLDRKNKSHQSTHKDPQPIAQWLKLVQNTKAKYGILDQDLYNLGEASFQFESDPTARVLTASERRDQVRTRRQEDCRWATVLQGISASGWVLPPYTIVKSEHRDLGPWQTEEIPHDWAIAASDTGWTTNSTAFEYVQEFEVATRNRTTGTWRLLILDGYQSDYTVELDLYCQHFELITLCMPPGLSKRLQPFDLGCSLPLKAAYTKEMKKLVQNKTTHITQSEFLLALKASLETALTPQNIAAGFQRGGLVPFNPEAVCPPTLTKEETFSWMVEIPSNIHKVEAPPIVMQKGGKILIEYREGLTEEKSRRLVAQFRAGAVLSKRATTKKPAFWDAISHSDVHEPEMQLTPTSGRTRIHRRYWPSDIVEKIKELEGVFDMITENHQMLIDKRMAAFGQTLKAGVGHRKRKSRWIERHKAPKGRKQGNDDNLQPRTETRRDAAQLNAGRQGKSSCGSCGIRGHNSRTCNKGAAVTAKS